LRNHCRRDEVIAPWFFMISDRYSSEFGTVLVLHIHQICLLVLGSIRCLVLTIDMRSFVPFLRRLQLPKRIKDLCRYKLHTRRWSDFSIVFGQLLLLNPHSEVWIFLPLRVLLRWSLQNAIHMIEHVIMEGDKMTQCDCIPFRHPQSQVSEWPWKFHDVLDDCPLIFCCEEWPGNTVFWILQPLGGEFS